MNYLKIISRLSVILLSLLFVSCSQDDESLGGGSSGPGYAPANVVNKEFRFYKGDSDNWSFKSFMRSENGDVTILTSSSIAVIGDETAYYEKSGDNSAQFECYFVTQVVVGGNIYGSWNQYELTLIFLSHNHGTFSGKQLSSPYDTTGTSISGRFIFDSDSEPSEFTWVTPPVTGAIDYKYLTINVWTDKKTERFLKFHTDGTFKQYLNFGGEEIKESGTYTIDKNTNIISLKSPSGRVSESFKVGELSLTSFVVFMSDVNGNYLSELTLEYRLATREDDIPPYISGENSDDTGDDNDNNNDNTGDDGNTDNDNTDDGDTDNDNTGDGDTDNGNIDDGNTDNGNNGATTGTISGHAWVDLGLPSGLKWATCNVGASSPEEYGGYYAWGETTTKNDYSWDTYKWCKGSYYTMTKYCIDSRNGTVDNRTTLDPSDDVAHVKWGGSWRMPNSEEIQELNNKCTWQWTTLNGVKGHKVTSKKNGNSIFLPAAGYRLGTSLHCEGSHGHYWSSSLYGECLSALTIDFDSNGFFWDNWSNRCYGLTVRPVCN